MDAIKKLYNIVKDKSTSEYDPSSYTSEMFHKGFNEIVKKYGEEAVEVVIASLSESNERLISEIVDNLFHLTCICVSKNITFDQISQEITRRIEEKHK